MNAFGTISYGAAAFGFLSLTVLLLASRRGRWQSGYLIAASALTACWAAILAIQASTGRLSLLVVFVAEMLRDSSWLLALSVLAGAAVPRWVLPGARILGVALLLLAVVGPVLQSLGVLSVNPILLLSRAGLLSSLLALIILEQIYRNSSHSARGSLKYFAIGVGGLFAYDLFLYSQAELLHAVTADAWNVRGLLNAAAVPLIAVAARRKAEWALEIFVSRQVVFYTTTFMAVGAYLIVMGLGGYYVREVGGEWGRVGQIVFFAGAAVVLINLVASSTLRRHARVFISKHFYRNKYDYRIEWLRFITTLSSSGEEDVRRTAVQSIAQIFSSPGCVLFTLDESARAYSPAAAWPMRIDAIPALESVQATDELARFLERTKWIVDLAEYRRAPDVYSNISLPGWLLANVHLRIVAPMLQLERVVGFFVMYEPPPPFQLTFEDRDLLKTVGLHIATHLAQHEADRKLAESSQFEAYNRLTAFMMHDLKNSIAQLKLVVVNAERHKHNPQFIDDAIDTIDNTVERMTRLIEQIQSNDATSRLETVALIDLARNAIRRCTLREPHPVLHPESAAVAVQADPERLTTIIEHVIRNAQEATGEAGSVSVSVQRNGVEAGLTVVDTGAGMDADFVRDRLFRPFDSTKGSKGMGIGAYQAREYVRMLGGHVEVQSSPGKGTRFSISLPLAELPAAAPAVADVI